MRIRDAICCPKNTRSLNSGDYSTGNKIGSLGCLRRFFATGAPVLHCHMLTFFIIPTLDIAVS